MAVSYKQYKPLIDIFIESETQLSLLSECSRQLLQTLLKEEIDLFIIEAYNKIDLEEKTASIVQYMQLLNRKQKYIIITQDESLVDGKTIFEYEYFTRHMASILQPYGIHIHCKQREDQTPKEAPKHMIIIDDDWLSAHVLKTMLSSHYQDIAIYTNALEGLRAIDQKIASKERVDAIFLDLMMPIMDGFKFLERQSDKFEKANIPVFIITARKDKEAVIKAFQHRAKEYIVKPYDKQIILNKLEKIFYENKQIG